MEGISKDTLINVDPWAYDTQQDLLNAILRQCKELNPWMLVGDFLVYAEAQGYKDFCQLKLLDCAVVMGWYSASKGVFYQCFPPGFEILNHSLIVTHVLPITNSANPK